jgi:hypothetical protein
MQSTRANGKLFCSKLTQMGIQLTNSDDIPQWTGGDRSGLITVQNVYAAISNSIWHTNVKGWRYQIWSWHIPPKIKFFTWLMTAYKLNTWDTLLKKGWSGPNFCHLCQNDSETTDHLFIKCTFTRQVWEKLALFLNFQTIWDGNTLQNCFDIWAQREHNLIHLPSLICWSIWLERNKSIFDNGTPSNSVTAYKALGIYNSWIDTLANKPSLQRSLQVPVLENNYIGWFDGATLSNGSQSGAGGLIKFAQNSYYKWTLNCGPGTNTRA